jgi:hypothetical protein
MSDLKKQWLKSKYYLYTVCVEAPERLYFDDRYWTKQDIREFFEDLCFGDNDTYERVAFKLSAKPNAARKRFNKWCNDEKLI